MTNYQYIPVIFIVGCFGFFLWGGGWFWFYRFLICIYLLTWSFFILLVLPVLGRGVLIRDRVNDIEISLISKNTILIKKKIPLFRMSILWWTRTECLNVVKVSGFFEWSYLQMDFSFPPNNPCLTRELTSTLFSC